MILGWWIVRTISVRRVRSLWKRYLLLSITTALAVTLLVAVLQASSQAVDSFGESTAVLGGSIPFEIRDVGGDASLVELGPLLKTLSSSYTIVPTYEIPVTVSHGSAEVVGVLTGIDLSLLSLPEKNLESDNVLPTSFSSDPLTVYLPSPLAERLKCRVGDVLQSDIESNAPHGGAARTTTSMAKALTVSGIVPRTSASSFITDYAFLTRLKDRTARATSIGLIPRIDNGSSPLHSFAVVQEVVQNFKPSLVVENQTTRRVQARQLLGAFRLNILIMVGVTFLVAAFTSFNGMRLGTLELERDVSTLRTLGCSRSLCFVMFLAESILVGTVGSLLGLTLGMPLVEFASSLFLSTASTLYLGQVVDPSESSARLLFLLLGLLAGIGSCVIGGLYPAWRVSAVPPAVTLRSKDFEGPFMIGRSVLGAVFCSGCSVISLGLSATFDSITAAYAAAFFSFMTLIFATPIAMRGLERALRGFVITQFRVPGLLSVGSIGAAIKRTALAVGVSSLGVSLMVGVGVLTYSFRETLRDWVDVTFQADLYVSSVYASTLERVAYIPDSVVTSLSKEVQIAAMYRSTTVSITVDNKLVSFSGVDLPLAENRRIHMLVAGSYPAVAAPEVLLSESASRRLTRSVGDKILILGQLYRVTGIYRDFTRDRGTILIDRSLFTSLTSESRIETFSLFLQPGSNPAQVAAELKAKFKGEKIIMHDSKSLRETVFRLFDETFSITTVMQFVVALIAGFGFLVSMVQHLYERRHSLRVLTVSGVSHQQLGASLLIESVLLLFPGLVLGTIIGMYLAYILVAYVNPLAFGWSLQFVPKVSHVLVPLAVLMTANLLGTLTSLRWLPSLVRERSIE